MPGQTIVLAHIALNAAESIGVAISGKIVGISLPATLVADRLTFDVSSDLGVTYQPMIRDGNPIDMPVTANTRIGLPPDVLGGGFWLKIYTWTGASPANQSAALDIKLIVQL